MSFPDLDQLKSKSAFLADISAIAPQQEIPTKELSETRRTQIRNRISNKILRHFNNVTGRSNTELTLFIGQLNTEDLASLKTLVETRGYTFEVNGGRLKITASES